MRVSTIHRLFESNIISLREWVESYIHTSIEKLFVYMYYVWLNSANRHEIIMIMWMCYKARDPQSSPTTATNECIENEKKKRKKWATTAKKSSITFMRTTSDWRKTLVFCFRLNYCECLQIICLIEFFNFFCCCFEINICKCISGHINCQRRRKHHPINIQSHPACVLFNQPTDILRFSFCH